MKKIISTAILLSVSVCIPAIAADMSGMKMDGHSTMAAPAATAAAAAKASGTVKSMDTAKGTITIAHGAVAAVNWPAMTMPFKISPDMVAGIQAGQKVDFEFVTAGKDSTITKIVGVK